MQSVYCIYGEDGRGCDERLKTSLDGIERILENVSSWRGLQFNLQGTMKLTATKVESRLLELAATSVLYRLVQRFACSLRRTVRDTSVKSLGEVDLLLVLAGCPSSPPRSGILAPACWKTLCLHGNRDRASSRASAIKARLDPAACYSREP